MSKKTSSSRGPYRSFYEVLIDGPQYQALTPHAKLLLFTLRMKLGASGIGVIYEEILPRLTGLNQIEAARCIEELRDHGWLKVDGNIFWVVAGLYHEPNLVATNPNHRAAVDRHLRGLPSLPIVKEFREYYRDWLAGKENAEDSLSEPAVDPLPMGSPIPSGSGERREETVETDLFRDAARHKREVVPISAAPSARKGAVASPAPETEGATFADFKKEYPKREGGYNWTGAEKRFVSIVKKGEVTADQLVTAAKNYRRQQQQMENVGTRHVLMPSSFLGRDERYLEHLDAGSAADEIAPEAAAAWDNIVWE